MLDEGQKRKVKEALCYLAPGLPQSLCRETIIRTEVAESTAGAETTTEDHRTDLYSLGPNYLFNLQAPEHMI